MVLLQKSELAKENKTDGRKGAKESREGNSPSTTFDKYTPWVGKQTIRRYAISFLPSRLGFSLVPYSNSTACLFSRAGVYFRHLRKVTVGRYYFNITYANIKKSPLLVTPKCNGKGDLERKLNA